MTRRDLLKSLGFVGTTSLLSGGAFVIPASAEGGGKPLRFGIISDLHHQQFGQTQEEVARLRKFVDASLQADVDFIIQNGDFCTPQKSEELLAEWNRFPGAKYHVLGNHDLDHGSKETFMTYWGMEKRYYSFDRGGFHFVVMDRNCFKKDDGTVVDYDRGNWYHSPAAAKSYSDAEQLDWLKKDLALATNPVIVFMHQPVFLTDGLAEMGNWEEILRVFDLANYEAAKSKGHGKVAAVFMGHDHDDRYGWRNGVHYFLLNSATYAYTEKGADFYRDSLYAFVTLDPEGKMALAGESSSYRGSTSEVVQASIAPRITSHTVQLQP